MISYKQLYINGHFCYTYKFGIVTNGLGIIRHIAFYDKNFFETHPDIKVEKKSDSPDEDKSVHDARLIPTLIDFFQKHPLINPKTFLGDAAFDSVTLYKALLTGDTFGQNRHFTKAYIPLNSRSGLKNPDYVEEWLTPIPKKTFVLILLQFVEQKNGILLTKSELLLNVTSTTSKKIFVWLVVVPKIRKLFMPI